MTDLQDEILDRLVGTPIGKDWGSGPLGIAARVIHTQLKLRMRYSCHRRALAKTLGWHNVLCEAVQGASSVLAKEDDRRALGIAVFRSVQTAKTQPKLGMKAYDELTAWMTLRAHALVCKGECSLREAMEQLFALTCTANKQLPNPLRDNTTRCPAYSGNGSAAIKPSSPANHRSVTAFRYAIKVCRSRETSGKQLNALHCVRECARVEALVNGVPGAASCCLDLAGRIQGYQKP
ncbi:MAG TPA: hypothetical protein VEL76_20255 [Gemmataceae bacterium]|nr:hypothetical protein [Gemmataceae bacterium]